MAGWVHKCNTKDGSFHWVHEACAATSKENTSTSPSSQILLVQNVSGANDVPTLTRADIEPPPSDLSLTAQAQYSAAYKVLHQRVKDAGLYQCRYITGYGPEIVRYILLASLSAWFYHKDWIYLSAVFLGLFWHQLVFTAHDLGHVGVSHTWQIDRIISIIIADWIGGLSIGWWVDNHNIHHVVTNHPSHDPDIEHLPFLAISPAFFNSLYSTYYRRILYFDAPARFFLKFQHNLFYIIMAFARFNLYVNSYSFLFRKYFDTHRARGGRWAWSAEICGIAFFWWWFGWGVLRGCGSFGRALAYLLISHAATSPLHVQIVLSHFSMSTADLGPYESFPHRQLRTTTDVSCPEHLGFIHGGLHLQVTHHLFPRLPRHNLRAASLMVKEYCKEQGLTYAEFGFIGGNKETLGVLRSVAEQVKVIGKVAIAEKTKAIDKRVWESEAKSMNRDKEGILRGRRVGFNE